MKKFLILFLLVFFTCPFFVLAEQININSANLSQLDEIVHVGPKTAQKIIDDRPYSSVQDLSRVKGIGDGKYLQDIINQGFACANCQATQQTTQPILQPDPQTQTSTPVTVPTPAPTSAVTYPSGVFINEILPNPKGPDGTDEWIELYNSNNYDVDLSGWQLQDKTGTVTTYTISQNTKISVYGFLVFKRPDTKIMLNNDQDGLNLLTPDKKIVDSMAFTSAPLGQSYNKTSSGLQWSTTLTPGAVNIITAVGKTVSATKSLPKTNNSVKNNNVNIGSADLSQSLDTNQDQNNIANPWFLFFTVLAVTIILAIIVLFIKLKLKKQYVRT